MNLDEAVAFLQDHQPLPRDSDLTTEQIETFDAVRRLLSDGASRDVLRLLIGALGAGAGFGVYQLIGQVLASSQRADVVGVLLESVVSPHQSVRSWAWELALPYADEDLALQAVRALSSADYDERVFAATYLADHGTSEAIRELRRIHAAGESDPEISNLLAEALAREV